MGAMRSSVWQSRDDNTNMSTLAGSTWAMLPIPENGLGPRCLPGPDDTPSTPHGCEPWEDLAVKLMLKWPNLHYSTSAFAPKYYPTAIIDYANTRGADKIIYAGYFPMGLSLERIMGDMPKVPFRDHVWPKFLRENALKVLGLNPSGD